MSGTISSRTADSLVIKDSSDKLITIKFIPTYTKIYQPPSAAEYTPDLLPIGIYISGTVLVMQADKTTSGKEELIGEILHLPVNGR